MCLHIPLGLLLIDIYQIEYVLPLGGQSAAATSEKPGLCEELSIVP